jgi:hypothetical protein
MSHKQFRPSVEQAAYFAAKADEFLHDDARGNFRQALHLLLQACLWEQGRKHVMEHRSSCSPVSYVDTWCTVRAKGPRRVGHTTSMCELGKAMFEKPLFLFRTGMVAKAFAKDFGLEHVAGYGNPAALESRLRGMSYDDVAEGPASRGNTEAVILRAAAPLSVSRDRFCLAFVG